MDSIRSRLISQEESDFLRFQLSLRNQPRAVKAALQRLCAQYESGARLVDPNVHRAQVVSLLFDPELIVRRWAYKAIALIGIEENVSPLSLRLREELDAENRTWIITAATPLGGNVRKICADAGFEYGIPFQLAARLFATEYWLRAESAVPVIPIDNADPLTLKWAALLSGYNRAPEHLFHPRYENAALMRELNRHSEPEVSEYSIWALWHAIGYTIADLGINLDRIDEQPPNVRRWINRLFTKDVTFFSSRLDLLNHLRRDRDQNAREGLALGLPQTNVQGLDSVVLDWHSGEPEEEIQSLLLEHMARLNPVS